MYKPETIPFLDAQMAVLSIFFQVFIILGIYKFEWDGSLSFFAKLRKARCSSFDLSSSVLYSSGGQLAYKSTGIQMQDCRILGSLA